MFRDFVVGIKNCLYSIKEILFIILYGSVARGSMCADSDVDIAIFVLDDLGFDDWVELIYRLAKCLNLPEDKVDLVLLNEDTPLKLRYKILGMGSSFFRDLVFYKRHRDKSL